MEKISDLKQKITECLSTGRYFDTRHAFDRKSEREISRLEFLQVLKSGYHEKKKDKFEKKFNAWNYAVRGKTLDRRELRVIISFAESGMLIITAIDLNL